MTTLFILVGVAFVVGVATILVIADDIIDGGGDE